MTPDFGMIHSLLISPLVEVDQGFETQELLDFAIAIFALVLLAVSLSAYRKTRLRRLLLVSVAFGLFAVEVGIRQVDAFVFAWASRPSRFSSGRWSSSSCCCSSWRS